MYILHMQEPQAERSIVSEVSGSEGLAMLV